VLEGCKLDAVRLPRLRSSRAAVAARACAAAGAPPARRLFAGRGRSRSSPCAASPRKARHACLRACSTKRGVLYSYASWAAGQIFVTGSPAYRLPSLLAGCLAVPLTAVLAQRLGGSALLAGLATCGATGSSSPRLGALLRPLRGLLPGHHPPRSWATAPARGASALVPLGCWPRGCCTRWVRRRDYCAQLRARSHSLWMRRGPPGAGVYTGAKDSWRARSWRGLPSGRGRGLAGGQGKA